MPNHNIRKRTSKERSPADSEMVRARSNLTFHSILERGIPQTSVGRRLLLRGLTVAFLILTPLYFVLYLRHLNAEEEHGVGSEGQLFKVDQHLRQPKVHVFKDEGSRQVIKDELKRKETLVLATTAGQISIVLLPEYSPESVDYIRAVVEHNACEKCTLYRAEKPGILQGIIGAAPASVVPLPTKKGDCPVEAVDVKNDCPGHDQNCACHGPVMTRGMVGWAAGQTGPDFFIDVYVRPALWWGTQHTVWGEIRDDGSFQVIDEIWKLPAKKQGGLTMLEEPISFSMSIVSGSENIGDVAVDAN